VLHECWYCGQSHEKARAKLPALGKVCNDCKKTILLLKRILARRKQNVAKGQQ